MSDKNNNDKKDLNSNEKKTNYLAVGIALGTAVGVALKNIGLGLAIGVAVGAGIIYQKSKNDDK